MLYYYNLIWFFEVLCLDQRRFLSDQISIAPSWPPNAKCLYLSKVFYRIRITKILHSHTPYFYWFCIFKWMKKKTYLWSLMTQNRDIRIAGMYLKFVIYVRCSIFTDIRWEWWIVCSIGRLFCLPHESGFGFSLILFHSVCFLCVNSLKRSLLKSTIGTIFFSFFPCFSIATKECPKTGIEI